MKIYSNREEARKELGFDHVDSWSDYKYEGAFAHRLVVWDGAEPISHWFNDLWECPLTGTVIEL